jgi:putative endonuclease
MPSSELSVVFCYVYLLRSEVSDNLYIGFTHNLRKRLTEHNKSLNRSTKAYAPWQLLYYEAHRNETDARRRENYLKTTAGGRAIKLMIREQFQSMNDLKNRKPTTRNA